MNDRTIDRHTPPVLDAYADVHGHLRVWCEHCKCWHQHGAGEGHRVAHCINQASPYRQTGYVLRSVRQPTQRPAETANNRQEVFQAVMAALEFRYNGASPLSVLHWFGQHDFTLEEWQQIETLLSGLLKRVQRLRCQAAAQPQPRRAAEAGRP